MLGLGDHPPAGIEDGRRAVAPLLDVGGVGRADERGAHLLGDAAEGGGEHLEAGRVDHRAILHEPSGRRRAVHPSPTHIVAPSSAHRRRAAHRRRPRGSRQLERRAGRHPRHAHAHDLDLAVRVGEPEPLAVAGVEPLARGSHAARPARSARGPGPGSEARTRPPRGSSPAASRRAAASRSRPTSVRRSPTAIPSAERTPPAAGTTTARIPSRSATSQAWSGPAPPNATSSSPRGSCPCSTLTTRIARTISSFATAITPSAAARSDRNGPPTCAQRLPRGSRVEAQAAGDRHLRVEPSEEDVGVGHRRQAAAAAVGRRPRIGARALRPDAQRPALVEPRDRPAARADGVDVDVRHAHRQAGDDPLRRDARPRRRG